MQPFKTATWRGTSFHRKTRSGNMNYKAIYYLKGVTKNESNVPFLKC